MSKSEQTGAPNATPPQPLRILIIEDSEVDAAIIVRYLESAGLHLTHHRVCTPLELDTALENAQWDVVLCDYSLPGMNIDYALKGLKTRNLDIPFIVVSGAIGEELAVAVMKAGAHDFIVKDRLSRLLPAIEREMREATARREREAALEKVAYLAAIVDSTEEAVVGQNRQGLITTWNAGAERLYGYTAEEAIGQPAAMLVPTKRADEAAAILECLQGGEAVQQLDTERLRKDGSIVMVCITSSTIKDSQGRVIGASFLSYDVTERKKMESERDRLISHLNEMLAKVKTLGGLLPICASCKKVRDDQGYWQQLETFVREHSGAEFSHSICPDCMQELYPQYASQIRPGKPK